jgi:hypothetical protein
MTKTTAELGVTGKPVIFISYSHLDEPGPAPAGAETWLTYVQSFLQPAMKYSVFDLWTDEDIPGGAKWKTHIKDKLAACDICILLVSRHSLNSPYCMDIEIETIRQRQQLEEDVHIFPIMLSPVPKTALTPLEDLNVRPKNLMPLLGLGQYDRDVAMSAITDEIAGIAARIAIKKTPKKVEALGGIGKSRFAVNSDVATANRKAGGVIDVTHLPETAYEKLQGRDDELRRLDEAWVDRTTNIVSLIAEGGAGKSALVNEWLKRMQADNYRGAESVLGWSFYSQGTKERATSAEQFLNWAIDELGIEIETTSAVARGEAIAEALAQRRVLLVLDGCEPLQHGLDKQQGELKDHGLRALLRRLAAMPPTEAHGLVVLTSRLQVRDIARWKDSAALVVDVNKLSDEAGAALLRDNGVWGTGKELQAATRDFGGHPLALGLLASFLKEKHFGDVRQRDRIRGLFHDEENPRHDHARRVMESYEKEWLGGEPVEHAIMHVVGLFDRPASGDCLLALRQKPVISGLTDALVDLDKSEWLRAVARLRDARLLAPSDSSALDALDAHPLVREWFGERLKQTNNAAWTAAHGQLYEHLRDTTSEGATPLFDDLAPLYQAMAHGCRANRCQEVVDELYIGRICRRQKDNRIEFYSLMKLGALGSDLAAISWLFDRPYSSPVAALDAMTRAWVLNMAAFLLRSHTRFAEALPALGSALRMSEEAEDWSNAAVGASNLAETDLFVGEVIAAVTTAEQSVIYADRSGDDFQMMVNRTTLASALNAAGRQEEALHLFVEAERRQKEVQSDIALLYSMRGYQYCDLLLTKSDYAATRDRAEWTLTQCEDLYSLLSKALDRVIIGRAVHGLALVNIASLGLLSQRNNVQMGRIRFDEAIDELRASGELSFISSGLLARAAFRRSIGDWGGAARDLDEVEEIAVPGPMKLYLCDMALERARVAFAKTEVFAPLNGLIDDSPPKPVAPDAEAASLREEAAKQLAIAADYIKTCGYHKRDEELAELEALLRGEKKFAELPPRV